MIITIDGPTASGKSTIAGALARTLGFYHVNSGLLYRALSYLLVTKCHYTEKDLLAVKQADIERCMDPEKFTYRYDFTSGKIAILYENVDMFSFLKDSSVDYFVTLISPQKLVREAMVFQQHAIAENHDMVTDGRDVGSHVFPQADYKFYLTADLIVRALRWQKDQENRGHTFTLQEAQERVSERDRRDQTRLISPLIIPEGAIIIDCTNLSREQTLEKILSYIKI